MAAATIAKESAPAYQWFPKDWLSNMDYTRLSLDARGLFRHFYDIAWIENGLRNDPEYLFDSSGCRTRLDFQRAWKQIACLFPRSSDGRLRNPTQEQQRKELTKFRKSRQAAARYRWSKHEQSNTSNPSNARALQPDARAVQVQSSASASASAVPSSKVQSHRRAERVGPSAEKREEPKREIARLVSMCTSDIMQPLCARGMSLPTEPALTDAILQQARKYKLPASEATATAAARKERKTWKSAFEESARKVGRVN